MKIAYLLFVRVVSLMKKLYKQKNHNNSSNTSVLAALLITFNLITVTAYFSHAFGFTNAKYNPSFSTRGVKMLIVMSLGLGMLAVFERTNRKMSYSEKRNHFKKIISKTPNMYVAIGYLITSLFLSIYVLIRYFL